MLNGRKTKVLIVISTLIIVIIAGWRLSLQYFNSSTNLISDTPDTIIEQAVIALDGEQSADDQSYTWEQVLSRDSIQPIYNPVFVPATEARYKDDELVIGVEIQGDARAYAIGALSVREMVNDTVGGTPILVTW